MNQSFNVTHRLIRTETFNCMNRSALRGYTDTGVKRVQWWAVEDERTCEVCGTNHGKKYDIDKTPNLPCHPGCRCTWLSVINDDINKLKEFYATDDKNVKIRIEKLGYRKNLTKMHIYTIVKEM